MNNIDELDRRLLKAIEEKIEIRNMDDELYEILHDYITYNYEDLVVNGTGRWVNYVTSIFMIGDRYFAFDWEKGLTESQEHYVEGCAYEVEPYEETIKVTKYRRKVRE